MIDYIEPPPILKPPQAVVEFAMNNNVKLLALEKNMPINKKSSYKGYKHYAVYPCYTDKDTCTILYKNKSNIRFATKDEERHIYWICR